MAIKIFEGITRKIAPVFIALAFVGWIVFVAGFGVQNHKLKDDSDYKLDDSQLYAYWAGSVLGPIVFILAVVHSFLWGFPSAIVGSVTAILSMMYISAVGAVLVSSGNIINKRDKEGYIYLYKLLGTALNLQFAGGFLTTLFWAIVLALWPWYKIDVEGQFSGF